MQAPTLPPSSRRRRGVGPVARHECRVDMTPMVDLGFLLVAFFVMTTEMSKPAVTKLNMPKESPSHTTVGESNALTVLLDHNKVYYYLGSWDPAKVSATSLSVLNGLGSIIRERQQFLDQAKISKDGRDGLMLMIKAGPEANYASVIDALDETQINGVKRYAIMKISAEETAFLATRR